MAFIALLFAGFAILLFLLGIGGIIIGMALKIINSKKVKKGHEKSRALSVVSIISLIVGILSLVPLVFIVGFNIISSISEANWQRNSLEYNVYADNIDRARTLLEKGADPNTYEKYIYPPIYFALENDNYSMAQMLLEYGANPDAIGDWNTQLLHVAVRKNKLDFIKLFVENGADINLIMNGQTPLDVAYQIKNNDEIINYLLANGAKQKKTL